MLNNMTEDANEISFVVACNPISTMEANSIHDALQTAGIPCYVDKVKASSPRLKGIKGFGDNVVIMVPEDELNTATTIINVIARKR